MICSSPISLCRRDGVFHQTLGRRVELLEKSIVAARLPLPVQLAQIVSGIHDLLVLITQREGHVHPQAQHAGDVAFFVLGGAKCPQRGKRQIREEHREEGPANGRILKCIHVRAGAGRLCQRKQSVLRLAPISNRRLGLRPNAARPKIVKGIDQNIGKKSRKRLLAVNLRLPGDHALQASEAWLRARNVATSPASAKREAYMCV